MTGFEQERERRHFVERLVVTGMAVLCGAIVALWLVDGSEASVLGYPLADAVVTLGLVQMGVGFPFLIWQHRSLKREQRQHTEQVTREIREAVHD